MNLKGLRTSLKISDSEIQGLPEYTIEEVKEIILDHINSIIEEDEIDISIVGIELHGSRLRGTANHDSDLDAVVEYIGDMKEDSVFNLLNEEPFYIDGVLVDINPISPRYTTNLSEYMKGSKQYDDEILNSSKNEK